MRKIVFAFILFLMLIPSVKADDNLVNIYLFHSETCEHCKNEIELLDKLEKEYSNIRVYKYEVSDEDNSLLFGRVTNLLDARSGGVPFTVIGGKYYNGFNIEKSKKMFLGTISYYSKYGYKDVVGEYIGNIELPSYEIKDDIISLSEFLSEYGDYKFDFLFSTSIDTENLDLSTLVVLTSLFDIFSGISFFVLLIVIFLLFDIKDKKKMFLYGSLSIFLLLFVYLILSFVFYDSYLKLVNNNLIKLLIAIIIIVYSGYKLIKEFCNNKEKVNVDVLDRKSIIKYLSVFIILIILLSISLLNNSLIFPNVLKDILYLSNLSSFNWYVYIIMYFIMYIFVGLLFYFVSIFLLNDLSNCKIFNYVRYIVSIIIGILIIFY